MNAAQGLTDAFAAFVSADLELPASCVLQAKRTVLNGIAAALGAVDSEVVRTVLVWARANAAPGPAHVWAHGDSLAPSAAALVDGTMIHALDYDDTHLASILHPTAPVLPAAFHLAEGEVRGGKALLDAYVRGVEVALRLGRSVFPSHFERGFHSTATAGAIGAAAAAAAIIGLDRTTARQALGIAAATASGLRETFGSDCKAFQVGCASRNGVVAAELARAGLTAPLATLEGPLGWVRAMSDGERGDALVGLGDEWLFLDVAHKAYACAALMQPIVDALIRLRGSHGILAGDAARIDLAVAPRAIAVSRDRAGRGGRHGAASIHHAAAVALIDGEGGAAQFSPARAMDPAVASLAERVTALADAGLAEDQARAAVVMRDGRRFDTFVEHCVGSEALPMSDALIERKFRSLAEGVLAADTQRDVIDLVWHLDELPDVRVLAMTLRRSSHAAA